MAWAHGLCSCCGGGFGTCCLASFFPCILIGKNAEALDQGGCCTYGFLSACFPCLSLIFNCQHRGMIREQKGIEGSGCNDCLVSWFCGCCAVIQHHNTIKNY